MRTGCEDVKWTGAGRLRVARLFGGDCTMYIGVLQCSGAVEIERRL